MRVLRVLIETMGARGLAPFVHEERASLARLRGDENERARQLQEAYRLFSAIGATGHAGRLARVLSATENSRVSS